MLRMSQGMLAEWLGGTDSIKAMFTNGVIAGYSGQQPGSANDAESGTLMFLATLESGEFTPGVSTNGINFDVATFDPATLIMTLAKSLSELWSGLGLADGTIGWCRYYANAMVTGASETAIRFDGKAAVGGGEFKLSSATAKIDIPITIDSCNFKLTMYRM